LSLSPKAIGVVAVGLVIAGILSLLALGLLNKEPVTARSGFTRLQKPAPEFTLPLLDGGELVLAQHLGQPVVINFWASWCPPCRQEARVLERTWRSYREKGVMFVGVNIHDTDSDAITFLKEFDVTYPNGLDRDGKITVDYGVIGLPVTFFVNQDGIVERRWVGAIREAQLVAWVEELSAGVAPSGQAEGENLESFFKLD
jgi:cytochrome c biogenesis protein CcmG/thiol:disulfide interchange protein DsbE